VSGPEAARDATAILGSRLFWGPGRPAGREGGKVAPGIACVVQCVVPATHTGEKSTCVKCARSKRPVRRGPRAGALSGCFRPFFAFCAGHEQRGEENEPGGERGDGQVRGETASGPTGQLEGKMLHCLLDFQYPPVTARPIHTQS
jgi:hypothetical protein